MVLVHGFSGGAAHWSKVIVELDRRGYGSLHAVENLLTPLADDARRTQQMLKQIDGPTARARPCRRGGRFRSAGAGAGATSVEVVE